ncbi:MAG: universal stress protein [Nitrospirota bacterium]
MYKKILAAINEYLNSEIAAKYALNLARICGSKLYLCFIAEKGLSGEGFNRAEDTIKRLFIQADTLGVEAEIITESGDPVRKIGEIVRHEDIDIVFAATRREDIERRFYASTVARSLSLSLPCSVALVRIVHIGKIHPKKILVPLKARVNHVKERAYFTAKIAEAFSSEVFIFHTPKPISKFFHGEIHFSPLEWEKHLPLDISHFMEHMKRYKVMHGRRILPGKAGKSITVEAFAKRHDLIIMGASQRSLLSSILKGNPVEEVLRETPCDLIIFRPRHEDT